MGETIEAVQDSDDDIRTSECGMCHEVAEIVASMDVNALDKMGNVMGTKSIDVCEACLNALGTALVGSDAPFDYEIEYESGAIETGHKSHSPTTGASQ